MKKQVVAGVGGTWMKNATIHLTTHNARIKYTQDGKFCTTSSVRKALNV